MGLFSSSKSFYQNICSALDNNDVRKIKTILVNANRKKVVLKLNENKLLMKAINTNNIEIFKELINYINTHKLLIPFNEKDEYGRSILYYAVNKNNSKMVKEVLDNADKRNIVLKLNEKYNGNYPISKAILNNNVEIVQLLLGYAKKHKIIMKYDENFLKGENLLYWAINKDNISMAIQLMQNNDEVININKKNEKWRIFTIKSC